MRAVTKRVLAQSSRTRLTVESLEARLTPSWGGVPPSTVPVPTSFVAVTPNASGDAAGGAAITADETDWYRFASSGGTFTVSASTPASSLDTVIAVYNSAGRRVAYNDDISYPSNTDSRRTVTLAAGTYYLGVTNYDGTPGGSYTWAVDGPSGNSPPPPPPPPPTTGGFSITLRINGMTTSQRAVFQQAANRWAQVITGDLPNATYNGLAVDDVLIDASATPIDGTGGVLGQAGPDRFRSGTYLPIHGVMQFDSADLAQLEASGGLYYTILHEMGHVLGIGTIWEARGLLAGAGTSNPRFTGANAVAAYNAIFGTAATGVPVEAGGGSGTRDSHWRESAFGNELMTGYLGGGVNPLSRVTAASLADLGYVVNLNAADSFIPSGGSLVSGGGGGGRNLRSLQGPGGPPSSCGCGMCLLTVGAAETTGYLPVAVDPRAAGPRVGGAEPPAPTVPVGRFVPPPAAHEWLGGRFAGVAIDADYAGPLFSAAAAAPADPFGSEF